jgi:hypothetical protein
LRIKKINGDLMSINSCNLDNIDRLLRVGKIATALGMFSLPKDPYPWKDPKFILTGGYTLSDLKTPLSQIERLKKTHEKVRMLFPVRV